MIRFILVILTAFLYLILSIPVLLVLLLIRKKKPEVCDKVSRSLIRWIFRVILFFSGTKVTVKGQENIPKDRAVLYIGNHRSYFDILVTYTTVPGSCGFVAKKRAFTHSAVKELDGTHPLPVSRPFRHQAGSADDSLRM